MLPADAAGQKLFHVQLWREKNKRLLSSQADAADFVKRILRKVKAAKTGSGIDSVLSLHEELILALLKKFTSRGQAWCNLSNMQSDYCIM